MILLTLPCAGISQITNQSNDSLCISPNQIKNIYVGLKQGERAKQQLKDCIEIANSLNEIIQNQNDSIQVAGSKIIQLNSDITEKQDALTENAINIQKLKNRKTPWYLHPVTYTIIGIITGVFITK